MIRVGDAAHHRQVRRHAGKLAYCVDSAGSPASRLASTRRGGRRWSASSGAASSRHAAGDAAVRDDELREHRRRASSAATGAVWPLFFNTLFTGFDSWIALGLAGLVAWQVVPNIYGMGTEESRARNEGKVVGDDADPMISAEMDESRYRFGHAGLADSAWPIPVLVVGLGAMTARQLPSPRLASERMGATLLQLGSWQLITPPSGPWAFNIGGVQLGLASCSALIVGFLLYRWKGDIPSNDDATERDGRLQGHPPCGRHPEVASSIQNAVTILGVSSFVTNVLAACRRSSFRWASSS